MPEFTRAEDLLFLDIETVRQTENFEMLDSRLKDCWIDKYEQLKSRMPDRYVDDNAAVGFENNGGIFSEFGKIVCISAGVITGQGEGRKLRLKSYVGHDETSLLKEFSSMLQEWGKHPAHSLCGHNIKEFDIPYIARRMIINGLQLPSIIDISGKKPWEVKFEDTLEMWKFGDFKHYTSLNLLTAVLGIPTPKDDIDGSMVSSVYYVEKNLSRIAAYCEKDVFATAQVYLRMKGLPILKNDALNIV